MLVEPDAAAPVRETAPPGHTDGSGLVSAARYYLDHKPRGFRDDCSGYVCAVYDRDGQALEGNTASFWELSKQLRATHKRKRPQPGDLAFFDNTYDRDGNGRRDDKLTHVAIVLEVYSDGTIELAHGGTSKGRTTMRMNLYRPDEHADTDGRVLNSFLRSRNADDDGGKRLSGELFRGFATLRTQDAQGVG